MEEDGTTGNARPFVLAVSSDSHGSRRRMLAATINSTVRSTTPEDDDEVVIVAIVNLCLVMS